MPKYFNADSRNVRFKIISILHKFEPTQKKSFMQKTKYDIALDTTQYIYFTNIEINK